jgi:hypothetical protein
MIEKKRGQIVVLPEKFNFPESDFSNQIALKHRVIPGLIGSHVRFQKSRPHGKS